ncbi:MAG: sugar ABC transporter permease [Oscillatoriales cyanobacterium SM2_2_1]|nr:sugar ABC transporter permease [Oscillatoriales cyanobacterium SM2_2_1]
MPASVLPTDRPVTPWLLLLPAMGLLSLFVFFPVLYLIFLSFTTGQFTRSGLTWVGLTQFLRLLRDPQFGQVVQSTMIFGIGTVVPSTLIPLGLAIALNRPGRNADGLRAIYFLPAITSAVAVGLGWRWLFQNDGVINQFFSLNIPWLSEPQWAMTIVIALSIWKQVGFNMVVFLAGLQIIPQSRYEAAALDGANPWQQFRYITLPGLSPTTTFVIIATTIFTFRSFEPIYVVTGGGPLDATNILVYFVYQQAFGAFDFGYAAAAATVLFIGVLGLVLWQLRTES